MTPSSQRIVASLLVIALVIVVLLWWRQHAAVVHPVAPPSMAERRGRALAAAAAQRSPPAPGARTPQPSGNNAAAVPTPASLQPPGRSLAHATADDYRRRARYPHHSVPIEDGRDPILRDREVSPNVAPGPGGNEPSLVSFPDQVSFESPDPIVLYAYLSVNGTPVPAGSMSGEIIDQRGETLIRIAFNDDGRNGDLQAADFVYAARIEPAADIAGRPLKGPYIVRVHAVTTDGEERNGGTGFLYSAPDAQLTGRYTDALADGNLEIRAEVEVGAAGRFHLEATLYSQSGKALAWAQNAMQLTPGSTWIPLTFFGLALRDGQTDGPYVLRFVALSTTTEMPNQKNRLVENAYVTQPYEVTSFSAQPFNDPNLLDTAERIERAAPPDGPPLEAEP